MSIVISCASLKLLFLWHFLGHFAFQNLFSPSRTKGGGLLFDYVVIGGDCLDCLVRRSKMDQLGKGVSVSLHRLLGSPMCPVQVVGEYLARCPQGQGPFLVHSDG